MSCFQRGFFLIHNFQRLQKMPGKFGKSITSLIQQSFILFLHVYFEKVGKDTVGQTSQQTKITVLEMSYSTGHFYVYGRRT